TVRSNPSPARNRASLGQWLSLHREGYEAVCTGAQSDALLHAGGQSAVKRHVGSLRQNPEAGLYPHICATGRRNSAPAHRRMDRGLQRNPSTFRAQDGFPSGVHQSYIKLADMSGETGGTPAECRESYLPTAIARKAHILYALLRARQTQYL